MVIAADFWAVDCACHGSFYRAGRDGVAADAGVAQFDGLLFGEVDEGGFAGAVGCAQAAGAEARDGGDVDDAAFLLPRCIPRITQHMRRAGLRAEERAGEIHIDHALPFLRGVIEHGFEGGHTCIVHQMIDTAKLRNGLRDASVDLGLDAHIAGQGERLRTAPALGLHGLREQRGFNIEQHHACALHDELAGNF